MLTVYAPLFVSAILALYIAKKLHFAFSHFKMGALISEKSMLQDLPSVSVCIPARNETHAMTECLERVIASTYPKLEIIVLDDSSGDDTSILIKSFAHAGVRFVEGSPLPEGWLGKNHALQGLLDEASGTYILYMDVDTHIAPDTIEQLVSYLKQEKASMISILPRREDGWRASIVLGTLRYYLELILHRTAKPATSSSAWMINRMILSRDLGGFGVRQQVVQPEVSIATALAANKAYRFLISTPMLGVSYEKKWRSQVDTSIRLLFPVLGGTMISGTVALVVFFLALIPNIFVIYGFVAGWSVASTLAFILSVGYVVLYALYLRHVWRKAWWVGAIVWPYILVQEIVVLGISINSYFSGTVTWKGRPITAGSTKK
jgi:glycosyltransferase involved in cell wall biosynthesis